MCLGCRVFGYHIIPIISWVSTQYFIYRFSIIGYTNSHILLTCIGIVCTLKLHFYENCQSKYLHLTKGHPSTENCCCTYTYCYLDQHCLSVATSTCIIRYIKCHHTHTHNTNIFLESKVSDVGYDSLALCPTAVTYTHKIILPIWRKIINFLIKSESIKRY